MHAAGPQHTKAILQQPVVAAHLHSALRFLCCYHHALRELDLLRHKFCQLASKGGLLGSGVCVGGGGRLRQHGA